MVSADSPVPREYRNIIEELEKEGSCDSLNRGKWPYTCGEDSEELGIGMLIYCCLGDNHYGCVKLKNTVDLFSRD